MPRPALGIERKRTIKATTTLTPAEYQAVQAAADRYDQTISNVLRALVIDTFFAADEPDRKNLVRLTESLLGSGVSMQIFNAPNPDESIEKSLSHIRIVKRPGSRGAKFWYRNAQGSVVYGKKNPDTISDRTALAPHRSWMLATLPLQEQAVMYYRELQSQSVSPARRAEVNKKIREILKLINASRPPTAAVFDYQDVVRMANAQRPATMYRSFREYYEDHCQ